MSKLDLGPLQKMALRGPRAASPLASQGSCEAVGSEEKKQGKTPVLEAGFCLSVGLILFFSFSLKESRCVMIAVAWSRQQESF